jgi:hypothetical protein
MSACNVLVQKAAVHIMVDGLSYGSDGVIEAISQKCWACPTSHFVVSSMGAGSAGLIFSVEAGRLFPSFDALVASIEVAMPEICQKHAASLGQSEFTDCEVYFAGWSKARNRPEAYIMRVHDEASQAYWDEQTQNTGYEAKPYKLMPITDITGNPAADVAELREAGLVRKDVTVDELCEVLDPCIDLLAMLEVQRRRKTPLRPGLPVRHWVGGLALLTSITRDGITQRVVHRWEEDAIGQIVKPRPIDWKAWRAARAVAAAAIPLGLSRLQRERMEKKARKGTLRAV